ncbi:hypothetical protein R0J91_17710, partial [Micrococcus sp. SIMBA_131]
NPAVIYYIFHAFLASFLKISYSYFQPFSDFVLRVHYLLDPAKSGIDLIPAFHFSLVSYVVQQLFGSLAAPVALGFETAAVAVRVDLL